MNQIQPFPLWLGNAGDGRNFRLLLDAGIGAVVQLAAEEPVLQLPREIVYFRIPLVDGTGNDPKLIELAVRSVAYCYKLRVPTLVCCGAGMSRTPAVAATAMALSHSEAPEKWLEYLTKSHPFDVSPGFWNEIVGLLSTDHV